jgi:hypothetical protein
MQAYYCYSPALTQLPYKLRFCVAYVIAVQVLAFLSHQFRTLRFQSCTEFDPFGTRVLHLIQMNHQPDATTFQFIILKFVYSLPSFRNFPANHQELNDCSGSLWFYLRNVVTVVLCLWSGRMAGPATAVIELLMMGGKTPETC